MLPHLHKTSPRSAPNKIKTEKKRKVEDNKLAAHAENERWKQERLADAKKKRNAEDKKFIEEAEKAKRSRATGQDQEAHRDH